MKLTLWLTDTELVVVSEHETITKCARGSLLCGGSLSLVLLLMQCCISVAENERRGIASSVLVKFIRSMTKLIAFSASQWPLVASE